MKKAIMFSACLALVLLGCSDELAPTAALPDADAGTAFQDNYATDSHVGIADVLVLRPAGDYGGGVLEPGSFFPPTDGGQSILRRSEDEISYVMQTTGLPPGAYTNWWAIFNNPDGCTDGICSSDDLFNPDADVSVFWSAGNVVGDDGIGNFRGHTREGELNGDYWFGNPDGLQNAAGAEVHIVVKYHGPASDDPAVLHEQLHTLLGSCEEGANAVEFPDPFGVQCFDPQVAVHYPN